MYSCTIISHGLTIYFPLAWTFQGCLLWMRNRHILDGNIFIRFAASAAPEAQAGKLVQITSNTNQERPKANG